MITASNYQNMTADSRICISCHSLKAFPSPFIMKAKLICSSSSKLVVYIRTKGLEGDGFICYSFNKSIWNYSCYPCKPGEYDVNVKHGGPEG